MLNGSQTVRWTAGVTLVCEGALTSSIPASCCRCEMNCGPTLCEEWDPRWIAGAGDTEVWVVTSHVLLAVVRESNIGV